MGPVMVRFASVVVLVLLVAAACVAPARADERVVVRFADSASPSERSAVRRHAGVDAPRALPAMDGVQVVQAPEGGAARAARRLERSARVLWAQPDRRVRATTALPAGSASSGSKQWGLANTGQVILGQSGVAGVDGRFTSAWDTTLGDASQEIAVVDTGVDFSIADLAANAGAGAHDYIDGDDDPAPGSFDPDDPSATSHGTHVAGIAAAALGINQYSGDVTGTAPGAQIMALRALDTDGSGWSSTIAAAFSWAAEHGARVVNASLSGTGESDAIADAIASHPNTLYVVAAGNGNASGVGIDEDALSAADRDYPCANPAPNVLCVAAVDNRGALARFSNYGARSVDVGAPGVAILSYVRGGGVQFWSGTSMATPHVAGAAALAFSKLPQATAAQVRVAMLASARPLTSLAGRTVAGGMVDAAALLERLGSEPAPLLESAVALPSGSPTVGGPLAASGGTFDGGTVDWSWERCDAAGSGCTPIAGALLATYAPTAADVGLRLRVTATATNSGGSTPSTSGLSAPVADPASAGVAGPAASLTPAAPAAGAPAQAAPAIVPAIASPLSARWSVKGARLRLRRLVVRRLPRGAWVRIACTGARCPVRSKTATKASGGSVDLVRALGRKTAFRAGQTLTVRISAAGYRDAIVRFALKRGRRPRAVRA